MTYCLCPDAFYAIAKDAEFDESIELDIRDVDSKIGLQEVDRLDDRSRHRYKNAVEHVSLD